MAANGLTLEDFAGEVVPVFEDNEQAFYLFCSLSTQWRVGMSGHTGLDYMVLYHKMDRMKLSEDDYAQLEADIEVMERAALEEIHSKPGE